MSYQLTEHNKKRIRPLLNEIELKGINFKYFLTIDYWWKMIDDIRVSEDNKHLRKLLRKYFKRPIRFFFSKEKHLGNPDSPVFLGYHRHILMEEIPDVKLRDIDQVIRKHHHSTPNGKAGLDIKLVKDVRDVSYLTSYMTKQIDYPQLNIDRTKVIDVVNSDIGKDHFSVKGEKRDDWIYQYKRHNDRLTIC
tara:strand:- start:476 stop:1051 length:576 start_codon:yes stop_codon:yes gene_type:complete